MVPPEPPSRPSGRGGAGAGPGEHGHVVRGVSAGHCALRRSAASAGDLCYFPVKSSTPTPPLHNPTRQSWIWGFFFYYFPLNPLPPHHHHHSCPGNAGSGASPAPPAFPSPGTAQLSHKVMCHRPDEQKHFPRYLFMDLGRVPGEEEPLCAQVSHPPGRSGRGSSRGAAGQPAGSLIIARHLHIEIAEQRMIN